MLEFLNETGNTISILAFRLLIAALAAIVIVCLIDFYRRPWHISRRMSRTLHRWEICNAPGEYPHLKRVRKNKHRAHELILELGGKSLALPDFDKHLEHFQTGLNGAIRMEYGKTNQIICLYLLPRKYVHPTIISPQDDAIGAISLQRLINLLVVGPTGTGKSVAIKVIMSKILKFRPDSTIWLLDFKKFDFMEFENIPNYYSYTDCLQGLKDYYAAFKSQQATSVATA